MINHFINLIDDPQAQLPAYHLAKLAFNLFCNVFKCIDTILSF